ncbi:TPA: SIR2 family protein, partial [Neisseria gonorrhoeae]
YFPIYGFSRICSDIHKEAVLKRQQKEKLDHFIEEINRRCKNNHSSIQSILDDENISDTYKNDAIAWGIWNNQLSEDEVENYLKNFVNKKDTHYKRLLCMFDYKKYADTV